MYEQLTLILVKKSENKENLHKLAVKSTLTNVTDVKKLSESGLLQIFG